MSRNRSLVCVDTFIEATRDSGYKGTSHALSELVDNSLQAGARQVDVIIDDPVGNAHEVWVLDDGRGMSPDELSRALQFGGTTRFDDRSGLGRYGMGLPNASLSQARRVEVYSWGDPTTCFRAELDIDRVRQERRTNLSPPRAIELAEVPFAGPLPDHGTLVRWSRADRLDAKRTRTIVRRLHVHLGRVYRYAIWSGVQITINGEPVYPIDPLFLSEESRTTGATLAEEWEQDFRVPGTEDELSSVRVRFSILPFREWGQMSPQEKRALGVSNGAGVSVVRADREIDYGWFFLRGKRRQNYDDWWRCEVSFEPPLDELFGITHTKQQVRPKSELLEVLQPPMVASASRLHAIVRAGYVARGDGTDHPPIEDLAAERDSRLEPITEDAQVSGGARKYSINDSEEFRDSAAFNASLRGGEVTASINTEHPFYRKVYQPITQKRQRSATTEGVKALVLAMARAELVVSAAGNAGAMREFRRHFGDALSEFLR